MANYIVDASIVIEYLVVGTYTPNVISFFNQVKNTDRLIVPEFCLLECTNVIWKQVRFRNMNSADGENLINALRALKLRRTPMKRLLNRTFRIAANNNLAVYDSGYISLALYYGYPLLTLDQAQSRSAAVEGVTLIPITNF